MKKYFAPLLLMVFAFNSYSQQAKDNEQKLNVDYLKKSRKQLETGLILLAGGGVMFAGGSYALEHDSGKSGYGALFIFAGMGMAATSIPFFISSTSNKHKAKLYMKKEALMPTPHIKTGIVHTSIGVTIDL